jgi:hypothetical protein
MIRTEPRRICGIASISHRRPWPADRSFAARFEGLTLEAGAVVTTLSGVFHDQAQLYGVLERLADCGLELVEIEVQHVGDNRTSIHSIASKEVTAMSTLATMAVTLRLPATEGAYSVDVHTASGAREIQVPTDPASERRVTVSTSSGKVEVLPR